MKKRKKFEKELNFLFPPPSIFSGYKEKELWRRADQAIKSIKEKGSD